MSGLKKQAVWLFGSTCFAALLQVLQLAVLARKLEAHELGLLAIINAILAVATVLQDMGMSSYIVHRQEITRREQSTIYWVNVSLSFCTGLIMLAIAWPVAWFYHLPELTALIMLTSLNFLVLGHLSQYQAHYVKTKRMVTLAKIEMGTKLFAFLCTVAMLYFTSLTVAAAILGLFINAFTRILCMIYFGEKSWRPTWEFDGKTFVSAVRYGIYQLGSQTINQLRTQADALIVGKVMGAEMLGIYSLAKELILQPLKLVSPVINRLALPRFAEKQHDPEQLKKLFLKGTFVIMLFSSAMYLAIGILSPVIVRVLYGASHEQVYHLIPLMLLFGMLRPMGGLTGAISQANGRTNVGVLLEYRRQPGGGGGAGHYVDLAERDLRGADAVDFPGADLRLRASVLHQTGDWHPLYAVCASMGVGVGGVCRPDAAGESFQPVRDARVV